MSAIISLHSITKRFGNISVLKSIDLEINEGEIFGLLGVNGAGKTTLIRSVLGLLSLDEGQVCFRGVPRAQRDIQEQFGFLPENFVPPRNLTARELLTMLSWGLGTTQASVSRLLELVGLSAQSKKFIRAYSRGMIQRLGLAVCLLKDPRVLILDEPTLGLDPVGQKDVLSLLRSLHDKGKTIFFSSHILSQMEQLCTRIGIIHAGTICFIGTVKEALAKHKVITLEEAFLREIALREAQTAATGDKAANQ